MNMFETDCLSETLTEVKPNEITRPIWGYLWNSYSKLAAFPCTCKRSMHLDG